jgi:C4-dicarboxylate transporter DctQ subunit
MLLLFFSIVEKISNRAGIFAGFVMVFMVFINVYGVVMRYIFNTPINWPMEVSEFSLVATAILGGAYTLRVDGHVNTPFVLDRLSLQRKLVMTCINHALIGIFSAVLIWKSWELAWLNLYTRSWSESRLLLFPSYIIVPIGAFFLLLEAINKIVRAIKYSSKRLNSNLDQRSGPTGKGQ